MKLLFCPECKDVFNLTFKNKSCSCGKTYGKYVDDLNAEISKDSIPLGFANSSFLFAVRVQLMLNDKEQDNPNVCCKGEEFTAFVIPDWATSIKRKT